MSANGMGSVDIVTDPAAGEIEITADLPATPARVFRALASREIADWWVRPGVFDTREWTGEVRPGGRWRASGLSRGQPYTAEGEYLEVDTSKKLVHTWEGPGPDGGPSTLSYALEPLPGGTRLTFRQVGFASPQTCESFAAGWDTSFESLAENLARERMRALTAEAAGVSGAGTPA